MTALMRLWRAGVVVGWAVLAAPALVPGAVIRAVPLDLHAAAVAVLVVALFALAVAEPAQLHWKSTMSTHLRVSFVLMVIGSGGLGRRMEYTSFAVALLACIFIGLAVGLLLRRTRTSRPA